LRRARKLKISEGEHDERFNFISGPNQKILKILGNGMSNNKARSRNQGNLKPRSNLERFKMRFRDSIPIGEITRKITLHLTITGLEGFRLRLKIAVILMRLAAWVAGMKFEYDLKRQGDDNEMGTR
jgi:hypothetical protein